MQRLIDILFALIFLVVFAPILLLIALLIKIDSTGSILYTPAMIGQNGRTFSLWRFRTISNSTADPGSERRLTRIGRFLRNYSLDHLPMLINLLKGDLTWVGPRPMEVDVVDLKDPTWQVYFQRKPGVFNYAVLKLGKLWPPSRNSDPLLNQELEIEYLQKRSPRLDLEVFLKSFQAFVRSRGNIKARAEPDPEMKDKISRHLP